jgi:hypothetical protein
MDGKVPSGMRCEAVSHLKQGCPHSLFSDFFAPSFARRFISWAPWQGEQRQTHMSGNDDPRCASYLYFETALSTDIRRHGESGAARSDSEIRWVGLRQSSRSPRLGDSCAPERQDTSMERKTSPSFATSEQVRSFIIALLLVLKHLSLSYTSRCSYSSRPNTEK